MSKRRTERNRKKDMPNRVKQVTFEIIWEGFRKHGKATVSTCCQNCDNQNKPTVLIQI